MPHATRSSAGPAPLPSVPRGWRARTRVLLWRWRLPLAALLLGVATSAVVHDLRPAPSGTLRIAVTARAVSAGATLTRADLTEVDVPSGAAPAGARLAPGALVGRTAAVDLPSGVPLVTELLGGALRGPAGTVVAVVRLADARTAALLRPGDHVDVVAAPELGGPGAVVARRALVLPTAGRGGTSSVLCSVADGTGQDGTVVLAVTADEALALSGSGGSAGAVAYVVP